MAETTALPSTKRFNVARVFEIILQPQRTFGIIAEEARPSWLTPMLILSITSTLAIIVRGYLNARAALMGEAPLPQNWEWWTPDMQSNYMQAQQSMQGPVFSYVIPLVMSLISLWLGWLILSGLLHLGSTLLGGRGTMAAALNVVAWASMPFAIRDALRILFMLISQHSIQSAGLSGFAGETVFLAQLLAQLDLFYFWYCFLLMIGFGYSENLTRGKVVAGITVLMILVLLIQAGIGTATSSISGLAFQRPF